MDDIPVWTFDPDNGYPWNIRLEDDPGAAGPPDQIENSSKDVNKALTQFSASSSGTPANHRRRRPLPSPPPSAAHAPFGYKTQAPSPTTPPAPHSTYPPGAPPCKQSFELEVGGNYVAALDKVGTAAKIDWSKTRPLTVSGPACSSIPPPLISGRGMGPISSALTAALAITSQLVYRCRLMRGAGAVDDTHFRFRVEWWDGEYGSSSYAGQHRLAPFHHGYLGRDALSKYHLPQNAAVATFLIECNESYGNNAYVNDFNFYEQVEPALLSTKWLQYHQRRLG